LSADASMESSSVSRSTIDEEVAACQSCRRRKLKCDRELPSCSQCLRLTCECIYEHKKQKPGLKSGAVESLNRRVGSLISPYPCAKC
jgi:hypothetical protein